jgi:CBS domain-containing protein
MVNRKLTDIIKDQRLMVLSGEASVQEACRRMWECRVGAALIADKEQRLVGIFTGRDAVRSLAEGRNAATTPLAQVMTPNPVTITPECRAIDALRAMKDRGFRHLPVVDCGRVVGIISRSHFKGMEIDRLDDEEHLWECIR